MTSLPEALRVLARGLDRLVRSYGAHCRRMDAAEKRRRCERARRRGRRRQALSPSENLIMTTRHFPVPEPPEGEDDPRFTIGLLLDVAELVERRGYPRPTGEDLTHLHTALFRFLYRER